MIILVIPLFFFFFNAIKLTSKIMAQAPYQFDYTCTSSIERLKLTFNYTDLLTTGKSLKDASFLPSDAIYWQNSEFAVDDTSLFNNLTWDRVENVITDFTIAGKGISWKDVTQGMLGDCYFLVGLATVALKP